MTFRDKDGLVEDNFLVFIANDDLMSPETKKKIDQLKGHIDEKELKKLVEKVFRAGYGAAVWDHEIGLKKE